MSKRDASPRPRKIAILVHADQRLESWETALAERLAQSSDLSLSAIVLADPCPTAEPLPILYRAVSQLDRRLFAGPDARPPTDICAFPTDIPRIPLAGLAATRASFDIVLALTQGDLPDGLLQRCTEAWQPHFRIGAPHLSETFGFREALEGHPVTSIAIMGHGAGCASRVVGTCITNTKFSAAYNAAYAKAVLASWLESALLKSVQGRAGTESGPFERGGCRPTALQVPTAAEGLRYVATLAARLGKRAVRAVARALGGAPDSWSLVVGQGDPMTSSMDQLRELVQPQGEFRADPFLFEKDGDRYVFFESYSYQSKLGRICVGRLEDDRLVDVAEIEIGSSHCSFPFVFEHEGEIYLIPETHERQRVEVWRCTDFPAGWELHATALEGTSPADTVFLEWQDECWLLCNLSRTRFLDHCSELHVFRVDGPGLGSVEPHPLNPVVVDSTRARNGGRPFVSQGRLVRPGQITSHGSYGYGLAFLEITALSMDEYCEREIRKIEPRSDRRTIGCHHLDHANGIFIMDARRAYGSKWLGARAIALRPS